jgi:hypothetical protein
VTSALVSEHSARIISLIKVLAGSAAGDGDVVNREFQEHNEQTVSIAVVSCWNDFSEMGLRVHIGSSKWLNGEHSRQ